MKIYASEVRKTNNKYFLQYLIAIILLCVAFAFSIGVGKYPIHIKDIIKITLGKEVDSTVRMVFFNLRLPRTIMVLIAGMGLSISGSIYQTIFKNPLATPDIIGVSSGATLGAAIAIVFLSGGTFTVAFNAFMGGIVAVFIAIGLARMSENKGIATIVLAGIVIGSITNGLIMILKFFADPERQLAAIEFWSMGSFAGITADKMLGVLPFFLLGIIILILLRWQINILSLSDDEGKSLGLKIERVRLLIIAAATLVVASIVSITGLISFISLIAPHIARIMRKRNDFSTTIFSGLIGSLILIIADCLARSIGSSEIPISILTTFIGAPYLAYLMSRHR
ncbi:iron ABC transporter permease [Tissierella sp. MB52-C2]|uniref:FecCD family ABC transporter permease n=1 Tax=Tissierella sp. MB52-C2 TaxID=3070999 RepID=UPI00280B004D|nr:iron ABC transporter permease [Tissierella sp. MB52-C2]WMM25284.1 iron ABC transporter permease [Tissierella sp. MB52-C2]